MVKKKANNAQLNIYKKRSRANDDENNDPPTKKVHVLYTCICSVLMNHPFVVQCANFILTDKALKNEGDETILRLQIATCQRRLSLHLRSNKKR